MPTLLNVDDYEHVARERLETSIYDYIAGGSWDEVTLTENRTAYDTWGLRPLYGIQILTQFFWHAEVWQCGQQIGETLKD
jgi:hypothetical protein